MRLPCGCDIESQYLPLTGGERKVTCEHDEYVVVAKRQTVTTFKIYSLKELEELGRDIETIP